MTAPSRHFRSVLAAGLVAVGLLSSYAATAQDAKAIYDQSKVEGNSCKKMQLACQAAKLDPKKKDYSDACTLFKTATNRSDERLKLSVSDSLSKGDFVGANRWAGYVCSPEDKQALLSQIADEQKSKTQVAAAPAPQAPAQPKDQSPTFLSEARSAYKSGNFDAALNAAHQITDPTLKEIAEDGIVSKINAYRAAESAARQAESSHDIQGAINNWKTAEGINGSGPDAPAANIARLEPLLKSAPPQAAPTAQPRPEQPVQVANNTPKPAQTPAAGKQPPAVVDVTAEVNKLLDEAGKQERANNLQAAVHAYDAVLRLQPANQAAANAKTALNARINSDPAEQAKSLAQAIRDFYSSKYADAEDSLRAYLDAPTARSKGAASFYLGATRLYEKILSSSGQKPETAIASAEVQRPFKEARAAGYQPVERFVSPVIMRAWKNAQ